MEKLNHLVDDFLEFDRVQKEIVLLSASSGACAGMVGFVITHSEKHTYRTVESVDFRGDNDHNIGEAGVAVGEMLGGLVVGAIVATAIVRRLFPADRPLNPTKRVQ